MTDIDMIDNFSFRNGETLCVQDGDLTDCRYALMFATVKPLPGLAAQRDIRLSDQGGNPGDMRRRHAGPAQAAITVPRQ